jgi:hypothetical protein
MQGQAWERCVGTHVRARASGLITPIRYGIPRTVISSIIIHHPSSIQGYVIKPSLHESIHDSPSQATLPCTQASEGSSPLSARVIRASLDAIFSSPPSIPYSSSASASVAAPCIGAWGSRLLPTLGKPGGQSQFRQLTNPPRNRVSSILRSGLGLSGDTESAASRTLKRQYFPQSLREGPHQRRLRPTQSVNRQDHPYE